MYHRSIWVIVIVVVTLLSGCSQAQSTVVFPVHSPVEHPTSTFSVVEVYPPRIDTAEAYSFPLEEAYQPPVVLPTLRPTQTLTPTLTLFVLNKMLPAPLYFLNHAAEGKPQIWRMERNGASVTQITYEAEGVIAFDVAQDGCLAYLTNNTLVVSDPTGSERKVLAQGEALPYSPVEQKLDDDFIKLTTPFWSPDGKQIAFGMGETWLADPVSGALLRVTKDRSTFQCHRENTYVPVGWMPDGSKVILKIEPPSCGMGGGNTPPNWGLGFVDPQADAEPINPGTLGCKLYNCEFSIMSNRKVLLGGFDGAGLWIIDPVTGHEQNLLPEQDPHLPPRYPTLSWPKQALDGRILFFYSAGEDENPVQMLGYVHENQAPFEIPEEVTAISRVDMFGANQALWSHDANIIVMGYFAPLDGRPAPIELINTLDGTVTKLNVSGYNFRWGK